MAIILNEIKKTYAGSKNPVIEHLNLTIKDGSFTVLLGPSGCGKTTLLRMIAGLEEVTDGTIYVDDVNITKMDPGNRNLAMVFQKVDLPLRPSPYAMIMASIYTLPMAARPTTSCT